ncbi:histone H2A.6 isoform 1 [Hibiscus syriacus]|uniref:Histone H2A.6 isoform 1 n=1 Tax=Hibiscus syriacus TaxID=106335 RepID=A0A6A3AGJ6_HIBSY|nr:histone H2A.6 isoform 1 [Hibiscus syriacus]
MVPLRIGGDQLGLIIADLQEEGSFDEAVKGCDGVFHVAASMEFDANTDENNESYVRSNIIVPAIKGTENLLNSCLRSNTVKRVVFTSSISTITAKDSYGNWRSVFDKSCRTTFVHVLNAKASGWVYVLSELLTEEAAFKFANANGIYLVSVTFLTTTIPSSIQVLLSPVTGDPKYFSILSAVKARMGSVVLVHIEDICRTHIFLMEQARAEGKYICCIRSCLMSEMITRLVQENPSSNIQRNVAINNFRKMKFGNLICFPLWFFYGSRLEAEEERLKHPEISSFTSMK